LVGRGGMDEEGRTSPITPTTPGRGPAKQRSKSSGRTSRSRKLEKSYSTGSELNHLDLEEPESREPSPTKDPLPMTDEMRRSLNEDSIHEANKQPARNESNGINNHSSKSRPGSPTTDSENEG